MKILSLDLGNYKTVGCDYESETGGHQFMRSFTTPGALKKLVQAVKPDRVVIEVCSIAGWVCDLLRELGIEVQVANTSDDAWRWRKVKQKDDRRDALKAARLSAVNQLREVYIPQIEVRQWRALITYRQHLVRRRTKIKNHIRDLLLREGHILARGTKCWNQLGLAHLHSLARPLSEVSLAELWRGELQEELHQLRDRIVVLSHGLWQRRFSSDPAVVGRSIDLDGEPYVVVGIMPPGFGFAPFWQTRAEMWVPLSLARRLDDRAGRSLRVFGRLAPGTTVAQAQAEMAALTSQLAREYPESNTGRTKTVEIPTKQPEMTISAVLRDVSRLNP